MSKLKKIIAEILFDGYNEPIKDGAVVFENGIITYAGTAEGSPNADLIFEGKTVLPGLWDCHVHFFGVKGASEAEWNHSSPT